MNEMWWKNAVIYEVYVDKFASNFAGLTDRLDYLKKLGINCVWLLPHYPSPLVDDGYDVSDYCAVRPELGTMDDFQKFTEEAHRRGIKIISDLVLNHVSIEHPWFKEASATKNNSKRDYFLWSKTGKELAAAANPMKHLKPSNWIYNPATNDFYFATFYPEQADLNWNNPEIFNKITEVVDFWISKGVDGFRLDAVSSLIKAEGTDCMNQKKVHNILKKLRKHIDAMRHDIILLAEAHGNMGNVREYFGNGDECQMVFNFNLPAEILLAVNRGDTALVKRSFAETANIPPNCSWANFLRNHDDLDITHISRMEKMGFSDWLNPKKDPTTRGASMRLATIFDGDTHKIIRTFELLFSVPGAKVIYYGEELGMKNLVFPDKPADTRKYMRGPFDWKEAEAQIKDPDSLLNNVVRIVNERKS